MESSTLKKVFEVVGEFINKDFCVYELKTNESRDSYSKSINEIKRYLRSGDTYLRAFIFVSAEPAVIALFSGFMAFSMGRTVVSVLSSSAYAKPWERANYMSLQNASQGIFTGLA